MPDLYSLMKESYSSRRPIRVPGCYSRSVMPLLDCDRNWLNREAKFSIRELT